MTPFCSCSAVPLFIGFVEVYRDNHVWTHVKAAMVDAGKVTQ